MEQSHPAVTAVTADTMGTVLHSPLSPSKADQWVICPGSVRMQAQFPETGRSESAEEGTATHWIGAEALQGRGATSFVGRLAPNGIVCTEEMEEAAKVYVAAIASKVPACTATTVEQPVTVKRVHPSCWGTPDCWYYDKTNGVLYVWDLKYGYSIVEPIENWQLMTYAIGILDQITGGNGLADQHIRVVLTIVQPRAFHFAGAVREWSVMGSDLRSYANRLEAAATQATGPNPFTLSGDHCRYCSARHACPSAHQASMFALDYIGQAVPQQLSMEALAIELRTMQRASDAIKCRLSALEAQAISYIEQGRVVPGFDTQRGTGRLRWKCSAAEAIALGDLMGVNLRKPEEPISPSEVRKTKKVSEDLLRAYIETPSTGIQLVPANNTLAARVFGIQ
jgi:hypothetical protein